MIHKTEFNTNESMFVGVDPSLTCTGVAIKHAGGVQVFSVKSKGFKQDSWGQRHVRINKLVDQISVLVDKDSYVFVESPAYASTTGSMHDRSGFWWFLYNILAAKGCVIVPIAPTSRAKYATGKGNAGKDAVLAAAIRRYPDVNILNNDQADATILLAMGCRLLGEPLEETVLPQAHLEALKKIVLPGERLAA